MLKRLVVIVALLLFCVGCENRSSHSTPKKLTMMAKPVTVVESNDEGCILQGSDGEIVVFNPTYYLSEILLKSGYKKGDILNSTVNINAIKPPSKVIKAIKSSPKVIEDFSSR